MTATDYTAKARELFEQWLSDYGERDHDHEMIDRVAKCIREAVEAEREACARSVETSYRRLTTQEFDEQTATQCRRQCAAEIRSRGEVAK